MREDYLACINVSIDRTSFNPTRAASVRARTRSNAPRADRAAPSRAQPTAQHPAKTLIVRAALKLWREDPHFTMAQLAKRVGMARITVHRITAGRAGLLNELRALDAAVPKQTSVRERLLQAALSIITDRGMHALTMTAVAQRASVAPATLYRQFADRPALLSALAEVSPARHAAQELELTLSDDVEADLTRFAAALLRFFVLAGDGFLHSLVAIRHSPELARALRARSTGRTQQRLERYLAQQVNAGRLTIKNTSHAASAFLGQLAFFGWLAPTVELPRPSEHELAQYVVRLFLQGVQAL